MQAFEALVAIFKTRLNKLNQACVAVLMVALILDVWVGVLDRYIFHWQLVWVEELARYIMIWAILLAVPCCTAGREHMGLQFVVQALPVKVQLILKISLGLLTTAFFLYIAYLGIAFAEKGASQLSTVFALPMSYAYGAIPITFMLSGIQSLLVTIEDICSASKQFSTPVLGQEGQLL